MNVLTIELEKPSLEGGLFSACVSFFCRIDFESNLLVMVVIII